MDAGQRTASSTDRPAARPEPQRWSPRARLIVSCLLAMHVLAIVAGPWSGPPPASRLAESVASRLAPYLFALHLNHGYRFFAPNPGPSHLVRYDVTLPSSGSAQGKFPDPDRHWPRLLYHRHFMISESMYGLSERVLEEPQPPTAPEGELVPPEVLEEYELVKEAHQRDRAKSDALAAGIASQLMHQYQGSAVRMWLVEHGIPMPQLVEQGMRLDDPSLFIERELGRWDSEARP